MPPPPLGLPSRAAPLRAWRVPRGPESCPFDASAAETPLGTRSATPPTTSAASRCLRPQGLAPRAGPSRVAAAAPRAAARWAAARRSEDEASFRAASSPAEDLRDAAPAEGPLPARPPPRLERAPRGARQDLRRVPLKRAPRPREPCAPLASPRLGWALVPPSLPFARRCLLPSLPFPETPESPLPPPPPRLLPPPLPASLSRRLLLARGLHRRLRRLPWPRAR